MLGTIILNVLRSPAPDWREEMKTENVKQAIEKLESSLESLITSKAIIVSSPSFRIADFDRTAKCSGTRSGVCFYYALRSLQAEEVCGQICGAHVGCNAVIHKIPIKVIQHLMPESQKIRMEFKEHCGNKFTISAAEEEKWQQRSAFAKILSHLMDAECQHVRNLKAALAFCAEMQNSKEVPEEHLAVLTSLSVSIGNFLDLHQQILVPALQLCRQRQTIEALTEVLVKRAITVAHIYTEYAGRVQRGVAQRAFAESPALEAVRQRLGIKASLHWLLLQPVQVLSTYQEVLKVLHDVCSTSETERLEAASRHLALVATWTNNAAHLAMLESQGNANNSRRIEELVARSSLNMMKMGSRRARLQMVNIFLFEDELIFTKAAKMKQVKAGGSYEILLELPVEQLIAFQPSENDEIKLHIWYYDLLKRVKKRVILLTRNKNERNLWIQMLENTSWRRLCHLASAERKKDSSILETDTTERNRHNGASKEISKLRSAFQHRFQVLQNASAT